MVSRALASLDAWLERAEQVLQEQRLSPVPGDGAGSDVIGSRSERPQSSDDGRSIA
jgi:hypothetical protein